METTLTDFYTDVIEASYKVPILVDFWAEWCQPCLMLGPILEKLAKEANGKWWLVKINTDEQPELAQQFQIRSIPAVKLFSEGRMLAEFIGALPETEIRRWLDKHLPSELKNQLEMAKAMLRSGNPAKARKMLEDVVTQDSTNVEAQILLALLLLPDEIDRAAELVKSIEEGNPFFNQANAIRTLHRLLHLAETPGAPTNDWNLYRQGITAFTKGRYAEALDAWIELVGRNRQLDDDGARKACAALFTLLGSEHELTRKYHRRFSSALY
ncbi:MAG: thioredoxin [candidate division KSB1 bacterium]|nr:thioredoxin [candidate division KSB1 bacterium]MDZ7305313.1 thioredoxin [candidate division KSB1 bacterium]MDZ7313545.1 thioredoxin [candidate division KSB1 bacterium]